MRVGERGFGARVRETAPAWVGPGLHSTQMKVRVMGRGDDKCQGEGESQGEGEGEADPHVHILTFT